MTTITIELPDDLAAQAARAGLLSELRINTMFESALEDAKQAQFLRGALGQLQNGPLALTEAEIQLELAARAGERIAQAGR